MLLNYLSVRFTLAVEFRSGKENVEKRNLIKRFNAQKKTVGFRSLRISISVSHTEERGGS